MRGRALEELIVANGMNVLNVPSESFTFSGPNGDIDVTLVNDACVGCRFEWELRPVLRPVDSTILFFPRNDFVEERNQGSTCIWNVNRFFLGINITRRRTQPNPRVLPLNFNKSNSENGQSR